MLEPSNDYRNTIALLAGLLRLRDAVWLASDKSTDDYEPRGTEELCEAAADMLAAAEAVARKRPNAYATSRGAT